jgi:hypothetical protein
LPPELGELIREQARDDSTDRLRPVGPERRETDLGTNGQPVDLDRLADPKSLEPLDLVAGEEFIHRGLGRTVKTITYRKYGLVGDAILWNAEVVNWSPRSETPCPACRGHPRPREVCLVCSASSADLTPWPMRDERRERAAARADLRGGTGPPPMWPDPASGRYVVDVVVGKAPRKPVERSPRPKPARKPLPVRKVPVRLVKPYHRHLPGDRLILPPRLARSLVDAGAAVSGG